MTGDLLEQRLRSRYKRARIDEYELTAHATRRLLERRIHADWIREALRSSSRRGAQPGTRKHVGPLATCVINTFTLEIITVGYGSFNDPFTF